jgi:hypothetical protein
MKKLITDWLQAAASGNHMNTDLNSLLNCMRTRTAKDVTLGLAVVGLLLCGSARADISLMNGAGLNGLYSTNVFLYGTNADPNTGLSTNVNGSLTTNAATFVMPFTVTTNRNSVLVIELMDINHDPAGNSPSFMTWSNANGTVQYATNIVSGSANSYNYYWDNIYYLYCPNPGPGTLICIDTNQLAAGTNTGGISFTNSYFNMTMQAFALQGVDTNYVPAANTSGNASLSKITVNSGSLPNYGYWAALCSADANTGHPLTNATLGTFVPGQPSGIAYYLDNFLLGVVNAQGYVPISSPRLPSSSL